MAECISIGQRCSAATVIKVAGLRKAAYPFDWVFSGWGVEKRIDSILNDDFKAFLDRSLYTPLVKNERCGHKHYDVSYFNHKDPLNNDGDYAYYERCVERFRDQVRGETPTYLIRFCEHRDQEDQEKTAKSISEALTNFGAKNCRMISIRNTSRKFEQCDKGDYDGHKIKLDKSVGNLYLFALDYHFNWPMLAKELKKAIEIVESN